MPEKSKARKQYQPSTQAFHETQTGSPNVSPGEAQHMPPAMGINTTDPTELGDPSPKRSQEPLNRAPEGAGS